MLKKVEQIKKKMAFPVTQWEGTAERKKQVASQVKMEARIGVRSQGMPDATLRAEATFSLYELACEK